MCLNEIFRHNIDETIFNPLIITSYRYIHTYIHLLHLKFDHQIAPSGTQFDNETIIFSAHQLIIINDRIALGITSSISFWYIIV